MQLLFYFGVFPLRLNASWVEARLVDGVGNHVGEG